MARMTAIAVGFCAVLLTPALASAQRGGADDRALAARVQRLEDTEAIERLLLNYGRQLDARDFKAYSLLFAKDGVWSGGMGTVQHRHRLVSLAVHGTGTEQHRGRGAVGPLRRRPRS